MNVPLFLTTAAALVGIVALALAAEQGLQRRPFAALGFSILSAVCVVLLVIILRWWKAIEPATFQVALAAIGVS